MTRLELTLLVLASYRLTHVIVFDNIAQPLRRLVPVEGKLAYLIHCYWCAGVWVSALLLGAGAFWPGPARWIVLLFAVAGGQAGIETLLRSRAAPPCSKPTEKGGP